MKPDIYRQLQRHLDKMPVPFPETKSGVEIRLLKHLFNEEEAWVALQLSAVPESVDKILGRFTKGAILKNHLKSTLDGLFDKGAILAVSHPKKGRMYSKLPLAIGIFEYQVNRITKGLAEDFYQYEEEAFAEPLLKAKTKQMRTIPVNIEVEPEFLVGSYDNARAMIEKSSGPYAVMNCVCRQAKEKMGEVCKQTDIRETCFTLAKSARFMVDKGVAREVSKDEMLSLVARAENHGLVLQPQNSQDPGFICCCCGCCCGVLTAAKKYPNPGEFLQTNFYAAIDPDKCTACGECLKLCQMDALVHINGHTGVQHEKCIGCGVCVNACEFEAISLLKTGKEVVPPKNSAEMYKRMVIDRYGILGALEFKSKIILGRKI
jgi:Pyruvate/2-oxoacid:ferredoxin oxidoreductase delta subunit